VEIRSEQIGAVTVLTVDGALTVDHGVAGLASVIRESMATGRSRLVLDLSAVEFMDSLGLEALLAANTTVEKCGGRLALASLKPRLKRLIEITRIGEILETHEDRAAAVDSLLGTAAT